MATIIRYSVFRYSPSRISGESINLGVLLYDPETDNREFRCTKKYGRISKFDDTLNINDVKLLLNSVKEDAEQNLFNIGKKFDINEYTRRFDSNYYFDRIKTLEYSTSFEEVCERIFKTYFRFDFPMSERPSSRDDINLLKDLLSSRCNETVEKDQYITGVCNDRAKYDILTDEYCIKVFNFDGKELSRVIDNAKVWAWNGNHSNGSRTPIVIYRYNSEKNVDDNFQIIKSIFKEAGIRFYGIEEGMDYLQKTS